MKIISWNIAGLNASLKRNDLDFLEELKIDIVCLQETKIQKQNLKLPDKKIITPLGFSLDKSSIDSLNNIKSGH